MKTRLLLTAMTVAAIPAFAQAQETPRPPAQTPAPQKPATQKPAEDGKSDVVVTGQSNSGIRTSIDRRSYSVSGDLQAQSGSISDALRNVPSVEIDVQGNISLRGDSNVTILIDGKPSAMFRGENASQALQQLPADQIDRVEVITNPSAEFRADGSAGIINLVTKKAKGVGRTGSIRMMGGSGGRVMGSANIGYNADKLTVTADLSGRHDSQGQTTTEDRGRPEALTGNFDHTHQDQDITLTFDAVNARVAADYDIDKKTRIGGEARFNAVNFTLDADSAFRTESSTGALVTDFDRKLTVDQERTNTELTATFRRKFEGDGHELSLSLSYEVNNDERVRFGHVVNTFPAGPDAFDRQRIDNDLRQTDFKGDYVRPLGEGVTLKAGFDFQFDDNSYDNKGFTGSTLGTLTPNATLTNLFLYEQALSQVYVTYERPFGDLTVLAGVRLEDAQLDFDQVTQGIKASNDYFRVYPSLHLAWKLNDTQQLTASYSKRVQRPSAEEFNPFRFLVDPYNYRAGNPNLEPTETDSYELGFQYRKAPAFYLATLYYRETSNAVADVITDLGGGIYLTTRQNVASSRAGGLELVANSKLTKTLSYQVSGNVFWSELGSQGPGFPGTRSTFSAAGRGSLNWQATPKDLIQLQGFVNGKRLTPQGYAEPVYGLNLGYRRKVNDKLSLMLTVQDVFGTFRDVQVIDTATLKSRVRRQPDTRLFLVGFTWAFGGNGKPQRDPGFDFGGPPPTAQ